MKNCKVSKLKGVVDNNNLSKLGHIVIVVDVAEGFQCPFKVMSAESFDCRIIGDGHFYKGTIDSQTDIKTEILATTDTTGYRVSPGKYKVDISAKYSLTWLQVNEQTVVLSDLDYSPNCQVYDMVPTDNPEELNVSPFALEGRLNVSGKYFKPYGLKVSDAVRYCFIPDKGFPSSFDTSGVATSFDITSMEALTEIFVNENPLHDTKSSCLIDANHVYLNEVLLMNSVRVQKDGSVYRVYKNVDGSILATYDPSQPEGSRWTYA